MLKTTMTAMLGIEHPIVQGGMGLISKAELVAAVSNAGALGLLTSVASTPEELRQEIRKTRTLTDKPFGINFPLTPAAGNSQALIEAALEEGIRIVETSGSSPEPYMKLLKDNGVKVIHKTPAIRFARKAESVGVDAVAMLGQGAGGHIGFDMVSSMVLVPAAADALGIPVLAAGEIADARGLVAALALGADGIMMGTRFMLTQEAPVHPAVKQWLAEAKETDTVVVEKSIRNPARVMVGEGAYRILGMESQHAKIEELMPIIISGFKEVKETGNSAAGIFYSGQAMGLVHSIPTVKELIDSIMSQADSIARRLGALGVSSS